MNPFMFSSFQPMLLSKAKEPFDDDRYIFEMKFDGMRAVIFATPESVRIQNRYAIYIYIYIYTISTLKCCLGITNHEFPLKKG